MINLKRACRTLFKTPFVTVVAIVSLALGIGANAAIFSLFNQMLLPAAAGAGAGSAGEPRLARARSRARRRAATPATATSCSATRCSATSSGRRPSFTGIAAHVLFGANLAIDGQTRQRRGHAASRAATSRCSACSRRSAGCSARRTTQTVGESHVVVLSHAYWQTRFGRESRRPRRHADRQRPADDDRRRRAARLRRHDARHRSRRCSCRSRMRGADAAGFKGFDNRTQLLGLPVRAAEARRVDRAGARGDQRAVPRASSTTSRRRCRRA